MNLKFVSQLMVDDVEEISMDDVSEIAYLCEKMEVNGDGRDWMDILIDATNSHIKSKTK